MSILRRMFDSVTHEILKNNPNIWIWGGDIIYSNTTNKNTLEQNYTIQKNNVDYQNFSKKVPVTGTWDDNDYGKNDGGTEYVIKIASQQAFLDFFDIPKNDARRKQEGVYHAIDFPINNKSVNKYIEQAGHKERLGPGEKMLKKKS